MVRCPVAPFQLSGESVLTGYAAGGVTTAVGI